MFFCGRMLENEEYSCSCENYVGHEGWRCKNCGNHVIITGDTPFNRITCYRITPDELENGMRLYLDGRFYEVVHIFPPQDDKHCQYVNLKGFGKYRISLSDYLLVMMW